jgi:hypothetical protein
MHLATFLVLVVLARMGCSQGCDEVNQVCIDVGDGSQPGQHLKQSICCGDHDFVGCNGLGIVERGSCGDNFCVERFGDTACEATPAGQPQLSPVYNSGPTSNLTTIHDTRSDDTTFGDEITDTSDATDTSNKRHKRHNRNRRPKFL